MGEQVETEGGRLSGKAFFLKIEVGKSVVKMGGR